MNGRDVSAPPGLRVTIAQARLAPIDPGRATALLLAHGTMELRWFAPRETDPQMPHDRDELYLVASGAGTFVRSREANPFDDTSLPLQGEERVAFGPGDALFVPAGAVHRFEDFSGDFAAWVVFYGPEGGERG